MSRSLLKLGLIGGFLKIILKNTKINMKELLFGLVFYILFLQVKSPVGFSTEAHTSVTFSLNGTTEVKMISETPICMHSSTEPSFISE